MKARIPSQINPSDCARYAQYLEIEQGKNIEFHKNHSLEQSGIINDLVESLRLANQATVNHREEARFYREASQSSGKTLERSTRQTRTYIDRSERLEEELREVRRELEEVKMMLKYRKTRLKAS